MKCSVFMVKLSDLEDLFRIVCASHCLGQAVKTVTSFCGQCPVMWKRKTEITWRQMLVHRGFLSLLCQHQGVVVITSGHKPRCSLHKLRRNIIVQRAVI